MYDAVIQALRKEIKGTRGTLLDLLHVFTELHGRCHPASMAMLVEGGVVEFAVAYLANSGWEGIESRLGLLSSFMTHPGGRERLCTLGVTDQLMQWIVTRLSQVRSLVGP